MKEITATILAVLFVVSCMRVLYAADLPVDHFVIGKKINGQYHVHRHHHR